VSEISGRLRNIRIESPSDRKAINWDGLIDEIQVIPLESDSDYLISAIDKLIVKEKFIYILDQGQQKIFIYYKDGKFFRKIEKGEAPNTSKYINDFTFDKQGNLLVLSYLSVEQFTPEGEKLHDYAIDFTVDDEIDYINPFFIGASGWGGRTSRMTP